jgi:hypothetical protein
VPAVLLEAHPAAHAHERHPRSGHDVLPRRRGRQHNLVAPSNQGPTDPDEWEQVPPHPHRHQRDRTHPGSLTRQPRRDSRMRPQIQETAEAQPRFAWPADLETRGQHGEVAKSLGVDRVEPGMVGFSCWRPLNCRGSGARRAYQPSRSYVPNAEDHGGDSDGRWAPASAGALDPSRGGIAKGCSSAPRPLRLLPKLLPDGLKSGRSGRHCLTRRFANPKVKGTIQHRRPSIRPPRIRVQVPPRAPFPSVTAFAALLRLVACPRAVGLGHDFAHCEPRRRCR